MSESTKYIRSESLTQLMCSEKHCYDRVEKCSDEDTLPPLEEQAVSRGWTLGKDGPLCKRHSKEARVMMRVAALEESVTKLEATVARFPKEIA